METEQAQIKFGAQLAGLQTKVRALKSLLSEDQLKQYDQVISAGKEKFLAAHPDCSDETMVIINKAFD